MITKDDVIFALSDVLSDWCGSTPRSELNERQFTAVIFHAEAKERIVSLPEIKIPKPPEPIPPRHHRHSSCGRFLTSSEITSSPLWST